MTSQVALLNRDYVLAKTERKQMRPMLFSDGKMVSSGQLTRELIEEPVLLS
jgi:hypothetical protein